MVIKNPNRTGIRSSQRWHWLLIPALLLTPISPTSQADNNSDEPMQIWVYSLYTPSVIRNKLKPYIEFLQQKTGIPLALLSSSTSAQIAQSCINGLPHIIIGSTNIGDQVIAQCAYHTVAVTYQPLKLYVRNNSSFTSLNELKNIGGIMNSDVTTVLYDELNQANPELNMIEYPNLLALMAGQDVDQLDGIILAQAMMIAAPLLDQDYHSIHNFNARGRGVVLFSPRLDEQTSNLISAILLSNGKIAEKVWQQGIGAGAFVLP